MFLHPLPTCLNYTKLDHGTGGALLVQPVIAFSYLTDITAA